MKKYMYIFALLIFAAIGLSSCTDDTQEMEQQISKLEQLLKTAQSDLETIKKQELSPLASAIKELNTKVAALEGKEPTSPTEPTDLSSLSAALETLKEKVAALEGKEPSTPAEPTDLSSITSALETLKEKVAALEGKEPTTPTEPTDLSSITAALETLKEKVAALEGKEPSTPATPTDLQTTIKLIEERLSKAESALKGIQQQPTPDGYDMKDLKETLDSILGDIETLKGKTPESTTPTDLSAISETLDLLKSRVAALEGKDPSSPIQPTEPTDLSSIEASIRELDAKIKDLVTTAVLKEALKDMLTSDAIKDFVTTAVLQEALKDKLTADDIKDLITNDKLQEALKDKLTNDDIKDLITNDKLQEALKGKLTNDDIKDLITNDKLQEALKEKLTADDITNLVTTEALQQALAGKLTAEDKAELETNIATAIASLQSLVLQLAINDPNIGNGHHMVDLGLSVMWATCNLGAKDNKPEDFGEFYAWGKTDKFTSTDYNFDNPPTELNNTQDVASVNWKGTWRIPLPAQWEELKNSCYWQWTNTYNDKAVSGYIIYKVKDNEDKGKTSSPKGKYDVTKDTHIFLPAAGGKYKTSFDQGDTGYYWSRSLYTSSNKNAYNLYFSSSNVSTYAVNFRDRGLSVRAVCELPKTK